MIDNQSVHIFVALLVGTASILLVSTLQRIFSSQYQWKGQIHPDRKGRVKEEDFFVEHYNEDTATISVHIKNYLSVEIELRSPFTSVLPELSNARAALKALAAAGVDCIDIGSHAEWIAAEFPYAHYTNIQVTLEQHFTDIASKLIELREAISSLKEQQTHPLQ